MNSHAETAVVSLLLLLLLLLLPFVNISLTITFDSKIVVKQCKTIQNIR